MAHSESTPRRRKRSGNRVKTSASRTSGFFRENMTGPSTLLLLVELGVGGNLAPAGRGLGEQLRESGAADTARLRGDSLGIGLDVRRGDRLGDLRLELGQ